jgi:hypothetical protein
MIVLFGHQSIGQNMLDGIRDLGSDGMLVPDILSLEDTMPPGDGTAICAFRVGRNRDPMEKFRHFSDIVRGPPGDNVNAAIVKLCYVDVEDRSRIPGLFAAYQRMIDEVQSHRPTLAIGHCTVPLKVASSRLASTAQRLFGRWPGTDESNDARREYNDLLRKRYAADHALFDLASIESRTAPAGRSQSLARAFTDDGSHLNKKGRRVVAELFLEFVPLLLEVGGASRRAS